MLYWQNGEYVGIGPGAHSHLRRRRADGKIVSRRWGNCNPVLEYVRRVEDSRGVEAFSEELDARQSMGETMMLGLRLVREGVTDGKFQALHGVSMFDAFGCELQELQAQGLVYVDDRARSSDVSRPDDRQSGLRCISRRRAGGNAQLRRLVAPESQFSQR